MCKKVTIESQSSQALPESFSFSNQIIVKAYRGLSRIRFNLPACAQILFVNRAAHRKEPARTPGYKMLVAGMSPRIFSDAVMPNIDTDGRSE